MADRAVEHRLRKENRAGETAAILDHFTVKTNRVDQASEKI